MLQFPDEATERRALELLIGEVPFTSWSSGEMLVGDEALALLGEQAIDYTVKGRAEDEATVATLRDSASSTVQ